MSAIKQQQSAQVNYNLSNRDDNLTQQERNALSLIWRDHESEPLASKRCESATDHCAELGYN